MYPPTQSLHLSVESLSGICGSISIACWVVVFSPQIIENFRRSSADGLSIVFIVVWLLGDVFNILGAVLQNVLPTMTILAIYYTLADFVLLGQCFYYRGFTLSDAPTKIAPLLVNADEERTTEDSPLLRREGSSGYLTPADADRSLSRRISTTSFHSHLTSVDGTHLSPATPLLPPPRPDDPPAAHNLKPTSTVQAVIFNASALLLVCLAGVFGWWLSTSSSRSSYHTPSHHHHHDNDSSYNGEIGSLQNSDISFDLWGQIFGYLCAIFYLGSRIPQLLLNYRRKSTEGVSMLFFLFACVGNLTYVMSILLYEPSCARGQDMVGPLVRPGFEGCRDGEWGRDYGRYVLMNASWLAGSAGTLLLDLGIFVQFWIYRGREARKVIADEDQNDQI